MVRTLFARAHPLTPIVWFAPIVAFALFDAAKASRRVELVTLPLVLGGWLTWSLAEYALHRFVFHMAAHTPREKTASVFSLHGYHHAYPSDRMRLVAPPLMSWPLACVVAVVIRQALGPAHWLPFFAGIVLGYLAYDYVHYYTHHFRPRRGWASGFGATTCCITTTIVVPGSVSALRFGISFSGPTSPCDQLGPWRTTRRSILPSILSCTVPREVIDARRS